MSIPTENIKNLKFTLRYPPDKILEIYEGSFTADASSSSFASQRTHEPIDHDFGTTVFTQLTYSLDGGTTWQDQDVAIPDVSGSTPIFDTLTVSSYSTTTQIIVVASSFLSTSKTVTYKVVAISKD